MIEKKVTLRKKKHTALITYKTKSIKMDKNGGTITISKCSTVVLLLAIIPCICESAYICNEDRCLMGTEDTSDSVTFKVCVIAASEELCFSYRVSQDLKPKFLISNSFVLDENGTYFQQAKELDSSLGHRLYETFLIGKGPRKSQFIPFELDMYGKYIYHYNICELYKYESEIKFSEDSLVELGHNRSVFCPVYYIEDPENDDFSSDNTIRLRMSLCDSKSCKNPSSPLYMQTRDSKSKKAKKIPKIVGGATVGAISSVALFSLLGKLFPNFKSRIYICSSTSWISCEVLILVGVLCIIFTILISVFRIVFLRYKNR